MRELCLNFSYGSIRDEGVIYLCASLSNLTELTSLKLNLSEKSNKISNKGLKTILECVLKLKKLDKFIIYLSDN